MENIKLNIDGVIVEMDKEEASKAIEAGEITINSDKIKAFAADEKIITYKEDEFETFKTNLANEEYKKGKTAGSEMTIKSLKTKAGIEIEGKDEDVFINAFKSNILEEAKVEPSKKITELQTDLDKMRGNYETLETDFNTYKSNITAKETRAIKDNSILAFIPEKGLKVGKDIALLAITNKFGLDVDIMEDGSKVGLINGQPRKDEKTLQPLGLDILVPEALKTLNLIEPVNGGHGGGDGTGNGQATNFEKFIAEMKANDINQGSEAFSIEMNKRIKEGTLKV